MGVEGVVAGLEECGAQGLADVAGGAEDEGVGHCD